MIIPVEARDSIMKANGLINPDLFACNLSKHFTVQIQFSNGDEHIYEKGRFSGTNYSNE